MFAKLSTRFLTTALSLTFLSVGATTLAAQEAKHGCACCATGAMAKRDEVADLDQRIAETEKNIAEKGDYLLPNVHASSKGPIRAKECLELLKKDREAAIKSKNSKPNPNSLVWVGKTHVRYSELPKTQQASAQICDHNGYRWITVAKTQWRIKNCAEIPRALQPIGSQKYKVACCQGGSCCGADGHCTSTGCCLKGSSCCEKSKDGTTVCNSKCGCILGCHG